ncbi:Vitamin B6 transporter TPN1 [Nakaseomyces bracarensis]|uniref:Vitamin B6 transporter TPN1 n=1 Tax=Nakaseomyces bracarensis TaxID=273131 RepID=A0ABR4P089_9SACH
MLRQGSTKDEIDLSKDEKGITTNVEQVEMKSVEYSDYELEKGVVDNEDKKKKHKIFDTNGDQNIFQRGFARLLWFSDKLDSFGVETSGIERIPPDQRGTKKQFLHVAGLWLSATGGLSSLSSFILGPLLFELSFHEALTSSMISVTLGCLIASYCSIMGPQSGCRQMVTARYLFGWWSVKLVALASVIGVMGWSVTNAVVGGEMLAAISHGRVPLWVGVVVVTVCAFVVAIFGIKQVLRIETYISVPVLTTFLLLYICSGNKDYLINEYQPTEIPSKTLKGNWISFFSLCYSITSTWGGLTSDYYILFPEDTPQYQVFLLTLAGTLIPTTFVGVLGLLLAAIAKSYQPYGDEYDKHGLGGLLWAGFERWNGFGKFLVVVLLLSLISNNIINTYSAAFGVQLFAVWAAKIPRWFWCIIITIIYLVCALVGRNHFSTILGNFLPMIGYWISMYFILLFEENVIFRRYFLHLYTKEFPEFLEGNTPVSSQNVSSDSVNVISSTTEQNSDQTNDYKLRFKGKLSKQALSLREEMKKREHATNIHQLKRKHIHTKHRYNWDKWNDPDVLTHGIAATLAFLCGVAGVVVGMAQTYWIGPVARKFGENGGDIAMWLSMGFSGIVYPWLRYWELKRFGR